MEPVKHDNVEWGTETKESTHGAFHPEAFPGSIGYTKFPDHHPATGKLIDYCLRENGGPFGRRKLHQNQPLPAAPVACINPIQPRAATPVQNWHPFTDVKPPPPNVKLMARLQQSAQVAQSMIQAGKGSSVAEDSSTGGGGGGRPDVVPKFTSQVRKKRKSRRSLKREFGLLLLTILNAAVLAARAFRRGYNGRRQVNLNRNVLSFHMLDPQSPPPPVSVRALLPLSTQRFTCRSLPGI